MRVRTIEEVQKDHSSNYHWVYTDKIRVRGVEKGFNNHVPTNSTGADELAARYCDSFVDGRSGYATVFLEKVKRKGRVVNEYFLETFISEEEVTPFSGKPIEREAHLMQQVNANYER